MGKHKSVASFLEWSLRLIFSNLGKWRKYSSTRLTSQISLYLGSEGLSSKTPLRNRLTKGCSPNVAPFGSMEDKADLAVFIVLYPDPDLKMSVKNSMAFSIPGLNMSKLLELQYAFQRTRYVLCCLAVPSRQEASIMSWEALDNWLFVLINFFLTRDKLWDVRSCSLGGLRLADLGGRGDPCLVWGKLGLFPAFLWLGGTKPVLANLEDRKSLLLCLTLFFCSVLGITLKGGKVKNFKEPQSIVEASIAIAPGSGLYDTYFWNWWLMRAAKRSISGIWGFLLTIDYWSSILTLDVLSLIQGLQLGYVFLGYMQH